MKSPWAKPEEAEVDPLEGARPGRTSVVISGNLFDFAVLLPIKLEAARAQGLALAILGDCLLTGLTRPGFQEALAEQKLALASRAQLLGACIELQLGQVVLHAVASSGNLEVAQRMAIDRIAQALTRFKQRDPTWLDDLLRTHYVRYFRNGGR